MYLVISSRPICFFAALWTKEQTDEQLSMQKIVQQEKWFTNNKL